MGLRQGHGLVREILEKRLQLLRNNCKVGVYALRQFVDAIRYECEARTEQVPVRGDAPALATVMVPTVAVLPDGVEWWRIRRLAAPLLTADDPEGLLLAFAGQGDGYRFRFGVAPKRKS